MKKSWGRGQRDYQIISPTRDRERERRKKKERKEKIETMKWLPGDRSGYPINKCMFSVTINELDKQTSIYPLQFHKNEVIKINLSTKKTMLLIKTDPENNIVFKSGFFSHTRIHICGRYIWLWRKNIASS